MASLKAVFLVVIGVILASMVAQGLKVQRVEVKMAECGECGMQMGIVSLQICGKGTGACCVAHNLDNLYNDDFHQGDINVFEGDTLGECEKFDLGEAIDPKKAMTVYHTGPDSVQFDFIAVKFRTSETLRCEFGDMLNLGSDYWVVGKDCQIIP